MDIPRFSLNGLKTKATIIDVYDGDTVTAIFPFKDINGNVDYMELILEN